MSKDQIQKEIEFALKQLAYLSDSKQADLVRITLLNIVNNLKRK